MLLRRRSFEQLASLQPPESLTGHHKPAWKPLSRQRIAEQLIDWGKLRPTDVVLDVGSGTGRVAMSVASYLRSSPRYEGIDVSDESIQWCKDEIEPRWPAAHFQKVDVRNGFYHPGGDLIDDEFRFPFPEATFDFVVLMSVFTHMLPGDVRTYLREIRRVTRPGGRSFITFFLLNAEIRNLIQQGRSDRTFLHSQGSGSFANTQTSVEDAIAYEESVVREMYSATCLDIEEPIRPGRWSGGHTGPPYQDIVIAFRR